MIFFLKCASLPARCAYAPKNSHGKRLFASVVCLYYYCVKRHTARFCGIVLDLASGRCDE